MARKQRALRLRLARVAQQAVMMMMLLMQQCHRLMLPRHPRKMAVSDQRSLWKAVVAAAVLASALRHLGAGALRRRRAAWTLTARAAAAVQRSLFLYPPHLRLHLHLHMPGMLRHRLVQTRRQVQLQIQLQVQARRPPVPEEAPALDRLVRIGIAMTVADVKRAQLLPQRRHRQPAPLAPLAPRDRQRSEPVMQAAVQEAGALAGRLLAQAPARAAAVEVPLLRRVVAPPLPPSTQRRSPRAPFACRTSWQASACACCPACTASTASAGTRG